MVWFLIYLQFDIRTVYFFRWFPQGPRCDYVKSVNFLTREFDLTYSLLNLSRQEFQIWKTYEIIHFIVTSPS